MGRNLLKGLSDGEETNKDCKEKFIKSLQET